MTMMEKTALKPLVSFPVDELSSWEQQIEKLPSVTRLFLKDHARVAAILQMNLDADSYLISPTYYFFTGRNGLWHYSSDAGDVFFCWHPNRPGHVLIFPPVSQDEVSVVKELVEIMPKPPNGLTLIRVKTGEAVKSWYNVLRSSTRCLTFSAVRETVLDWYYPVRILSAERTAKMQGHEFMLIRNRVRQIKKYPLDVQRLSLKHIPAIEALASRWAMTQATDDNEFENLVTPYREMIDIAKDGSFEIDGLVFIIDGRIEAATLWDVSNGTNRTANLYMNLCNTGFHGLAEFYMKQTAETLAKENIQFLNLGGSETAGLDRFKNKFQPAQSIDLMSIEIGLDEIPDVQFSGSKESIDYVQA